MFIFFLIVFLLIFPVSVHAVYDPLARPNNRFGIHIVETKDVPDLSTLVNSTGGDWGYVTMVLSDSDRDHDRWQNIFNEMRRLHLIPIVRLATHTENGVWATPQKDRFYEIVRLLSSLNWPTENRYVVLYNEPNHASEWGGVVDPEDYADTFVQFARALKAASSDFFILPAGLDASSADDEALFLARMITAKPDILTLMDGWTSHSYPNPGFAGSPYARGRGTITTFNWELSYLQSLGLSKKLPVFITETGWQHSEGKMYISGLPTSDQVGQNLQIAAAGAWTDPRIAAITPFIYNYQDVPFDHFSWRRLGDTDAYPQLTSYQQIPKIKGEPKQHESYTLLSDLLPPKLIAGSTYTLTTVLRNDGQGILNPDEHTLTLTDGTTTLTTFVDPLPVVEPADTGSISIHVKMPERSGPLPLTATLHHNGEDILLQTRTVDLVPPPSAEIRAALGWRKTSDAAGVSVLIYDKDTLLQKFTDLSMKQGMVTATGIVNVVLGHPYRVVILIPGYLPRQVIGALADKTTVIYPKRFLPFDVNGDGQFTFADVKALLPMSPWKAILRFFGP